jgi:type IV pilus assembly protein PilV
MSRRSAPRLPGPRARAGFTLVEVVFAIVVLSVGLLALAGLGLAASRLTRGGSVQTVAASMAQARFDSIASVPCLPLRNAGTTTSPLRTFRGVRERWAVTAGSYRINLVDTLWVPGRRTPLVFRSVLPCR